MAEGFGCWTRNLVVLGSSTLPAATHWICSWLPQVQLKWTECVMRAHCWLHFAELTVVFFFFVKNL